MDGSLDYDVKFLWYDSITNNLAVVVILVANVYLFVMAINMRKLFRHFKLVKGYGGEVFLGFFSLSYLFFLIYQPV